MVNDHLDILCLDSGHIVKKNTQIIRLETCCCHNMGLSL